MSLKVSAHRNRAKRINDEYITLGIKGKVNKEGNIELTAAEATKLLHLAVTDPLTGLSNRRPFELRLEEAKRGLKQKDKKPFAVVMIDIDHFGMVNKTYGEDVGDQMLQMVASIIKHEAGRGAHAFRKTEIQHSAARWGGEEFAVLLSHSDRETFEDRAEEIRKKVAEATFYLREENRIDSTTTLNVTISIGLRVVDPTETNLRSILSQAIKAMRTAKKVRNRVVSYDSIR